MISSVVCLFCFMVGSSLPSGGNLSLTLDQSQGPQSRRSVCTCHAQARRRPYRGLTHSDDPGTPDRFLNGMEAASS